MKYIQKTTDFLIEEPTAVTLGKFDGLHLGHKLLLDKVIEKKADGYKSVLFTFDFLMKDIFANKVITTNEERVQIAEFLHLDYVVECPFDDDIRNMEPEAFVEKLVKQLNVKYFAVGYDFHFGYQRKGDYQLLERLKSKYGYELDVIPKAQFEQRDISSSFIREEIIKGNIEKANRLLGFEFFISGMVQHGNKIGRTLGIPTINQIPQEEKLLPPHGVYVSKVCFKGEDTVYNGITNVGNKPTVSGIHRRGVETHIFGLNENLYEKEAYVMLIYYLRPEKKFASLELLKEQIKLDIEAGKKYYENITK